MKSYYLVYDVNFYNANKPVEILEPFGYFYFFAR